MEKGNLESIPMAYVRSHHHRSSLSRLLTISSPLYAAYRGRTGFGTQRSSSPSMPLLASRSASPGTSSSTSSVSGVRSPLSYCLCVALVLTARSSQPAETVGSIGYVGGPHLPFADRSIRIFRQAMALDEQRVKVRRSGPAVKGCLMEDPSVSILPQFPLSYYHVPAAQPAPQQKEGKRFDRELRDPAVADARDDTGGLEAVREVNPCLCTAMQSLLG